MLRLVAAITSAAFALSLLALSSSAEAVAGYDSSYFGESAFLTLSPGQSGQFVAIFTNTGSTGWTKRTVTQVNLVACLDDKVSCGVAPEESAWNDGSWLSSMSYATHTTTYVGPGQNGFFVYRVQVPSAAAGGTLARFNGDLALATTGQRLHPQGYYQDARVASDVGTTGPPPSGTSSTMSCGVADNCPAVAGIATGILRFFSSLFSPPEHGSGREVLPGGAAALPQLIL